MGVPTVMWENCFSQSWKGLLVPAAFAHPAKFARGLVERILDFGLAEGFWEKGSLILDPFAGVACGGVVAAYKGLRWLGVELEPRFHALALENFALHRRNWDAFGDPRPVILCADSRNLPAVLADGVVSSPPYADATQGGGGADPHPERCKQSGQSYRLRHGYGNATEGQLGAMPAGSVDGVVSSPPYAAGTVAPATTRSEGSLRAYYAAYRAQGGGWSYEDFRADVLAGRRGGGGSYGTAEGQLGAMPAGAPPRVAADGQVDCVLSSPPYHQSLARETVGKEDRVRLARGLGVTNAEHISPIDMERVGKRSQGDYGATPGQLGAMPAGSVDGVVSSPPYAGSLTTDGNRIDWQKSDTPGEARHRRADQMSEGYGATEGQLGAMPAGAPPRVAADGVLSSPPYEGSDQDYAAGYKRAGEKVGNLHPRNACRNASYGSTNGNLGNAAGTTFWEAARDVLLSTHAVCKPGAVTAWVLKAFVRKRRLVDFPGDWTRLLAACGFEPFLVAHALLDRVTAEPSLFGGEERTVRSRRSFFRRLAEKKGAPPITREEVVFARRV